jgi:hypothetical protein
VVWKRDYNFDPVYDEPDYGGSAMGNAKADGIKARTEGLIDYLRTATAASGPLTQGAAAHAIQAYETGAFWAVKALNEADAVRGDDGGGEREEAEERDGQSDP